MANSTHSNPPIQNFAPNATVQTGTQEGEWMYLQKASEVTGLHEKTLRRYIKKKLLKSKRLGKQINSPLQVWITPEIMETVAAEISVVEETSESFEDEEEVETGSIESRPSPISTDVEQVIKVIAQQFADKLDEQKQLLFEMRNELVEKDRQLLLLPDLQKKLEEKENTSEFERIALQKQVQELQNELERVKAAKVELEERNTPWWRSFFGVGK